MLSALNSDSQTYAQVEDMSLQPAHPRSSDNVDLYDEGPLSLPFSHPGSSVGVESSIESDGPSHLLAINSIDWRLPLSSSGNSNGALFPQHSTSPDSSQATTPSVLRRGVSPQRRSLERLVLHLAYPAVMVCSIAISEELST
jgi:hypothetical protein